MSNQHSRGRGCGRKLFVFLLVLVLFGFLALLGREVYYLVEYPVEYRTYVEEASAEFDVPETLIYAVIKTESGFDPEAVSNVGARGLMQITEDTFDWLRTKEDFGASSVTFSDLDQPDISIAYGTYFLQLLLQEFHGDIPTALSAYHAGRASVHSWLENPAYSENGETLSTIPKEDTAYYVKKVTTAQSVYERRLAAEPDGTGATGSTDSQGRNFFDRFVENTVGPWVERILEKHSNV